MANVYIDNFVFHLFKASFGKKVYAQNSLGRERSKASFLRVNLRNGVVTHIRFKMPTHSFCFVAALDHGANKE